MITLSVLWRYSISNVSHSWNSMLYDYLHDNWGLFCEHIPYPMRDIFEILCKTLCDFLCDKWGPFHEHIPYPMWVILEIQSYAITYVITWVRFMNTFTIRGHLEVPGRSTRSKNFKTPFFEDICYSFNEGTHIGPEPHQLFSFWDISTNTVARDIQSFGWNGPWQAGCLSFGQNFFVKFAETCDEQMLKISRRYLDFCLKYS